MKQLHVEASTYCNARCPLCPRSLYGYKVEGVYPEMHLTKEKLQVALDRFPEIEYVYFNGHLGDPMMNPNIADLIEMTKCNTDMTTNGSLGTKQSWQRIADHNVGVRFSIDGLEDTNHLYRQDLQWSKIMERVKWFIDAGGRATWKYITFKHNIHQVEQAEELSKQLGFKEFIIENHGRNYGPALDREGNISHWLLPADGSMQPGNYDVPAGIKRYKETHQNFTPEDKVYDIKCEHLMMEDVYINARGEITPCCYHGYDMPGRPVVLLEDHDKLMATWKTKKCNPVCAMTCGQEWRTYEA